MGKTYLKTALTFTCVLIATTIFAQTSTDGLWNMLSSRDAAGEKTRRNSTPTTYHLAQLNLNALRALLVQAPVLHSSSGQSGLVIEFPNAEGHFEKFAVYESSIMDPVLEAKFPMIKTYAAQGIDDPTATMRFSVTQFGLHTMSLSGIKSTVYIDPYTTDLANYIVYDRNGLGADPQEFKCLTEDEVSLPSLQRSNGSGDISVQNINDQKLRTYRLAQSCAGEYGTLFKGTGTVAQQKANVQAQMTITINRVNSVYERDLAIHLTFIANNDVLIYLDPTTDPWSGEYNTTTAQTIDAAIGVSAYDIGHNFNTSGGGNAGCLSCVCLSASQNNTHKGRGYTGSPNPTGDPFDIDYVAHEMGHQFGGYHVMNTCSRSGNGTTEVEPASGSSIMGYAGICPTNIQSNSHADFNYVNIRDISANIKTGNSTCAAITTLTNTPPTASAGLDYVIPKSTAYILEGTGADINGNSSLTYNWSQNDPDQSPGTAAPVSTYAVGPLYRALPPSTSPNRYMPALATVISNTLASTWEVTPSVGRTLNFSFIVRDNNVGGGQTASDLMLVTVDGTSGPFIITSQGSATTWSVGTTQTITWNVAGTASGSVNTPNVNIFFSTDGGYTYPTTLATNVPNSGSASITVPSAATTTGRVMVRGAGNIFYDINNANITIAAAPGVTPVSNFSVTSVNPCTGTSIQLTDQSLNAPTSWTWTATSSTGVTFSNANAQSPTVSFANAGTYTISLVAKNTTGSNTNTKVITVNASPVVAVNSATICSGNAAALTASGATTYNWSNSSTTAAISVSPVSTTSYTVTGTSGGCTNSKVATVTVKTTPTVAANSSTICSGVSTTLSASGATTYLWSNSATTANITVSPATTTNYNVTGTTNGCTNTKTVTVTVKASPTVAVNSSTICSGTAATLNASGATTYNWSNASTTANITVSPTTTTSYTVTGTSNGCTNSKVTTVTVKASPNLTVNSATICPGNFSALMASGASTYNWSTGVTTSNIIVSPTTSTSYTVTGTTNGCSTTKVANVSVYVLPAVTLSMASYSLCSNSTASVSLTGTPAGGTFSGPGVSGNSFNPALSGSGTFTLTYSYTDANSCSKNDQKTVSVNVCTGINELSNSIFTLYPNPATGYFTIDFDSNTEKIDMDVFDAIGKLVLSETNITNHSTFSLEQFAKGIYNVRLRNNTTYSVVRLIKQ